MVTALVASLSAALYGVADFLGGFASRKDAALRVTLASQLVGLAVLLGVTLVLAAGVVERSADPVGPRLPASSAGAACSPCTRASRPDA